MLDDFKRNNTPLKNNLKIGKVHSGDEYPSYSFLLKCVWGSKIRGRSNFASLLFCLCFYLVDQTDYTILNEIDIVIVAMLSPH